ncbi:MAG: methyltransferase domain-containing protein [Chitinophagales bacterium]
MLDHFKTRASEIETMDDLSMEGEELSKALDQLTVVNRFLGGYKIVINGLQKIFNQKMKKRLSASSTEPFFGNPIRIADLGCGGGDTLRAIADWNVKNQQLPLQLHGIDANTFTIEYAKKRSPSYPAISYAQKNIFSDDCNFENFDIVICSLFLHHFTEEELLVFLTKCKNAKVKALLVNDLQRHWMPYYLFKLVCGVFGASKMTREDGLLSIRKAFTKSEFEQLIQKTGIKEYNLQWKWAFRYQLICYF